VFQGISAHKEFFFKVVFFIVLVLYELGHGSPMHTNIYLLFCSKLVLLQVCFHCWQLFCVSLHCCSTQWRWTV